MALGSDVSVSFTMGATAVLSPDGSLLAFVGQSAGRRQLYLRRLSDLQATPLAGTEDAQNPFFSPDGQWVAFFANQKLKKIAVTGGNAVPLADAPDNRGGAWCDDGTIVFTPERVGLFTVSSAGGGRPAPLTSMAEKEVTQRWPQALPGGRAVPLHE